MGVRTARILTAAAVSGTLLAASGTPAAPADRMAPPAPMRLRVTTVMSNLDIPWDTAFLPGGSMLVTERDRRRILLRTPGGEVRVLASQPSGVWSSGETGLMSIAVDPGVRRNDRFYTCHGSDADDRNDVRVVAWRLSSDRTSAARTAALVTGLPVTSGRHVGCRLEITPDGLLWIGTGDATSATPQRLNSLGGKVLRVNRFTGGGASSNPFAHSGNADKRRVFTYGHRNVQGLAFKRGVGMWSVEHGTYRDDEVNLLVARGNYGWAPGPSYDESRPMTDFSLPGRQRGARWSSGEPTIATSGATWLTAKRWGPWRGRLAVATLKASSLRIMRFDARQRFVSMSRPPALTRFGRLRSVTQAPGGALFVTTSNGDGEDRVLRVVPRR